MLRYYCLFQKSRQRCHIGFMKPYVLQSPTDGSCTSASRILHHTSIGVTRIIDERKKSSFYAAIYSVRVRWAIFHRARTVLFISVVFIVEHSCSSGYASRIPSHSTTWSYHVGSLLEIGKAWYRVYILFWIFDIVVRENIAASNARRNRVCRRSTRQCRSGCQCVC